MTDQLKPCPFCGEKKLLRRSNGRIGARIIYFIECEKCFGRAGWALVEGWAIRRWNRRAR